MPKQTTKRQWALFLLVGTLSMFLAEVLSGASKVWLFDWWSLLVTYPLYLFHLLFFFNLALRTKKTSIPQLYIWGCLFAMYESWITQVLWVGYGGTAAMGGTILGIAVGEFLGLVFFWHPVFSFILPILIFEMLALSVKSKIPLEKRIIPSHLTSISKPKRKYFYFLLAAASIIMARNNLGDFAVITGAFLVSYPLIYIFYKLANKDSFSVYSLRVGKKGMTVIVIYLVLLYTIMFLGLGVAGKRIPGVTPIISTIVLYALFIWLIWSSKQSKEPIKKVKGNMNSKDFLKLSLFNISLVYVFSIAVHLAKTFMDYLMLSTYWLVSFIGFFVGIFLFYKAVRKR